MHEIRIVKADSCAVESSLHVAKHRCWGGPDHVSKHSSLLKEGVFGKYGCCPGRVIGANCPNVKCFAKTPRDIYARNVAGVCVLCDQIVDCGRICTQCREILPWNDTYCECCGQAMQDGQPAGVLCAPCQANRPPYEKARAPLLYDFPVDAVLKAIKFKRQLWYVPAFAALLLETLRKEFPNVDALIPVPLHRWRRMTRGFNQAMEFCRPLAKRTALQILTQVTRSRATVAQTGLNAAERRANMRKAFAVSGKLKSRHPLIVDDVITTGETCSQLAIELLKSGAESVSVLTVARAYAGATGLNV